MEKNNWARPWSSGRTPSRWNAACPGMWCSSNFSFHSYAFTPRKTPPNRRVSCRGHQQAEAGIREPHIRSPVNDPKYRPFPTACTSAVVAFVTNVRTAAPPCATGRRLLLPPQHIRFAEGAILAAVGRQEPRHRFSRRGNQPPVAHFLHRQLRARFFAQPLGILNALEGKPLPIYGDGKQVRDWLHVEDHCRAIALVLEHGRLGETYNVGGLNQCANLEAVRLICSLLDARAPREDGRAHADLIEFVADRPGHDRRYAIDCSKLQRALGWRPSESFETGLAKTVDWYLSNRAWCGEITVKRYARERLGRTA